MLLSNIYIDTASALNISDAMTKALGSNKIKTFLDTMSLHGLVSIPDSLLTLV